MPSPDIAPNHSRSRSAVHGTVFPAVPAKAIHRYGYVRNAARLVRALPDTHPVPRCHHALPSAVRVLVLGMALLMASGCAGVRMMWAQDPVGDLEQALEEQDFDRARMIIDNLPARHRDHDAVQEFSPRIEQAINRFEQTHASRAEGLAQQGKWRAAHEELDAAREKWSRGSALDEADLQLEQRQQEALQELRADLTAAEARWMVSQLPRRRDLDDFTLRQAQADERRFALRQRQLLDELDELARWFAEREDWARVASLLTPARQLSPDDSRPPLLEQAQEKVARESRGRRAHKEASLRQKAREKLARYEQSGELDDLLRAQVHVEDASRTTDMEEERKRLEQLVHKRLDEALHTGDSLYAQGDYQGALDVWKSLLPLAPEHRPLQSRLERLQRVLESLEKLEES